MESNFKEDLTILNRIELKDRLAKVRRDKKFAQHKVIYWNTIYNTIFQLECKLIQLESQLKGVCDICFIKVDDEDKLRSLPSGEKVCKKCWNKKIDEVIKNRT